MFVYLNGELLKIGFKYNELNDTTCEIKKARRFKNGTLKVNKTAISAGEALLHKKDQFVKAKGRKLALLRALKSMDLSKADREIIWAQYLFQTRNDISDKIKMEMVDLLSTSISLDELAQVMPLNVIEKYFDLNTASV